MNYYFVNAMRLEGDLMSRGKEVKNYGKNGNEQERV